MNEQNALLDAVGVQEKVYIDYIALSCCSDHVMDRAMLNVCGLMELMVLAH